MKGIWNALLISGRGFSSAQFGKIRNALDPRILQFALKYLMDGFLTGFEATRREVPLPWAPLGEGAAKRRVRVGAVCPDRPSPGLRPPSARGRGTSPPGVAQ